MVVKKIISPAPDPTNVDSILGDVETDIDETNVDSILGDDPTSEVSEDQEGNDNQSNQQGTNQEDETWVAWGEEIIWEENKEGQEETKTNQEDDKDMNDEEMRQILESLFSASDEKIEQQQQNLQDKKDEITEQKDAETDPQKKQELGELESKYQEVITELENSKAMNQEMKTKYDALLWRYQKEVDDRIVRDADMFEMQRITDTVAWNPMLKNIVALSSVADNDDSAKTKLTTHLKSYLKELSGVDVDALEQDINRRKAQAEMWGWPVWQSNAVPAWVDNTSVDAILWWI